MVTFLAGHQEVGGGTLAFMAVPHRGTMYRRLQEFDAAVEDLLKALDMMSESQERAVQQAQRQLLLTYNDFAVHCYLQGAYQEGVLLLNKALKDEQQEKGLYINRGGEQGLPAPQGPGLGWGRRASGPWGHTLQSVALDKLATVSSKHSELGWEKVPRGLENLGGHPPPTHRSGSWGVHSHGARDSLEGAAGWVGAPGHWGLGHAQPLHPSPGPRLLLPAGQPALCGGRLPAGAGTEPAG